jgi:hypothetical protein
VSSTVQDEEAIEEACDEVGSRSGTTDDDEEGGGSGVEVRVVVAVDDLLGERGGGGGAAVPFRRGGSGSDLSPSPYVNPAFSSRASMFLHTHWWGQ